MNRDFKYFRDKYTIEGARSIFEVITQRLISIIYPNESVKTIQASRGDAGIDIAKGDIGINQITVYQCKFFLDKIEKTQEEQIKKSLKRAINTDEYSLKEWILVIPKLQLTLNEQKWWDKLKTDTQNVNNLKIDIITGEKFIHLCKINNIYNQIFEIEDSLKLDEILNILKKKPTVRNTDFVIDDIPTFIYSFKNKFQLVNEIDEVPILLEEAKLNQDFTNNSHFNVQIDEEVCLIDELSKLKNNPRSLLNRKKILEIEKILKYLAKCKSEIEFSINSLLNTYAYNVTSDFTYLANSLNIISEKLIHPQNTMHDTKLLEIFEYKNEMTYYSSNDITIDVWKGVDMTHVNFKIYLSRDELFVLQKKAPINTENFEDFLHNITLYNMSVFDLNPFTISTKVIPKFIISLSYYKYLIDTSKKELFDLSSYKIGLA